MLIINFATRSMICERIPRIFIKIEMYKSLIQQLYRINVSNPVKMGLDNSRHLYKLLGEPLKQIPIIHVGGTNGKGTVCFKISEGLRHSSIKTGLFVSPHISSFRERVCINGTAITEQDVLVSFSKKSASHADFIILGTPSLHFASL